MNEIVSNANMTEIEQFLKNLKEKLVFTLTVFPRLTSSQLQVGIGPHIQPRIWRPVLEELIADGTVIREDLGITTPIGQYRTLTVLSLANPQPLELLMESYQYKGVNPPDNDQTPLASDKGEIA